MNPLRDEDMESETTEILSTSTELMSHGTHGSTEVGTSISSTRYQLDLDLPGPWGPIRLFREARLDDENGTLEWIKEHGLIYSSMDCRSHRIPRKHYSRTDGHQVWYCHKCDNRVTIFKDSIFEHSRLPIGKVLMIVYCFANRLDYEETRRTLIFDHSEELVADSTIAYWFDLLRDILVDTLGEHQNTAKIGGPGKIVQVDEALIGRRKYNRGRLVPGTWVVGLIDKDGAIRLEVAPRRDAGTLQDIIERHAEPGSIIHTDGWKGYIGTTDKGFQHRTVNHSEEFVAEDGTHTQRIESQWRALRRYFHQGGKRHDSIPTVLAEYTWRRTCLFEESDCFVKLLHLLRV